MTAQIYTRCTLLTHILSSLLPSTFITTHPPPIDHDPQAANMAGLESYRTLKRRGSTWSLPGLLGGHNPSKSDEQPMPTTPDALESYRAFEKTHFRTIDEYVKTAPENCDQMRQSQSTLVSPSLESKSLDARMCDQCVGWR